MANIEIPEPYLKTVQPADQWFYDPSRDDGVLAIRGADEFQQLNREHLWNEGWVNYPRGARGVRTWAPAYMGATEH